MFFLSSFSFLHLTQIQPVATAAANGSLKDLVRLSIVLRSLPGDQAAILLPIFYLHLDPSTIPDPGRLDEIITAGTPLPSIDGAVISLNALSDLVEMSVVPVDASPDLWPRVWKWMHFLHSYWEYLPGFHASDEVKGCLKNSSIVLLLSQHPATALAISATPGIRRILATSWAAILHDVSLASQEAAKLELTRLLALLSRDIDDLSNLDEVVDGVGGSYNDLAAVIIEHISQGVAAPTSETVVTYLGAVITVLEARDDPLNAALMAKGIVLSLLLAIDTLQKTTSNLALPIVQLCFILLSAYLKSPAGYRWITQALEAGLLQNIVDLSLEVVQSQAHNSHIRDISAELQDLVSSVISGALVSYPVVSCMKRLLPTIKKTSSSPKFAKSVIFDAWRTFSRLVEERVKVLDTWEAANRPSFGACDNMLVSQALSLSAPQLSIVSAARSMIENNFDVAQAAELQPTVLVNARQLIGTPRTEPSA